MYCIGCIFYISVRWRVPKTNLRRCRCGFDMQNFRWRFISCFFLTELLCIISIQSSCSWWCNLSVSFRLDELIGHWGSILRHRWDVVHPWGRAGESEAEDPTWRSPLWEAGFGQEDSASLAVQSDIAICRRWYIYIYTFYIYIYTYIY